MASRRSEPTSPRGDEKQERREAHGAAEQLPSGAAKSQGSDQRERLLRVYDFLWDKVDARNLTRAFYSALEKAKITNFRFHDLRHTFATRLAQPSVDLYKVQRLLGHKSPTMTQRYAHHSPEGLRERVLTLERHHPSALPQIYHTEAVSQTQRCVTTGAGNGI
jgi:integrase